MYKRTTCRGQEGAHLFKCRNIVLSDNLHLLSLFRLLHVMACISVQCLQQFCVCYKSGSTHMYSMCCRVFIHHIKSWCWEVVHCIAVDTVLVTTCKECAGNGWLWLLDMCHILQMCSLYVRILLVKYETLHSAWLILDHQYEDYYFIFYMHDK